jgi:hypothetical protein
MDQNIINIWNDALTEIHRLHRKLRDHGYDEPSIQPEYDAEKFAVTLSDLENIKKGDHVYAIRGDYKEVQLLDSKHWRIKVETDAISNGYASNSDTSTFYMTKRLANGEKILHETEQGGIMLKLSRGLTRNLNEKMKRGIELLKEYEIKNEEEEEEEEEEEKEKEKEKEYDEDSLVEKPNNPSISIEETIKIKVNMLFDLKRKAEKIIEELKILEEKMKMEEMQKENEKKLSETMNELFMKIEKKEEKEKEKEKEKDGSRPMKTRVNPRNAKVLQGYKEICYHRWVNQKDKDKDKE